MVQPFKVKLKTKSIRNTRNYKYAIYACSADLPLLHPEHAKSAWESREEWNLNPMHEQSPFKRLKHENWQLSHLASSLSLSQRKYNTETWNPHHVPASVSWHRPHDFLLAPLHPRPDTTTERTTGWALRQNQGWKTVLWVSSFNSFMLFAPQTELENYLNTPVA